MDVVESVLENVRSDRSDDTIKSITVHKELDLEFDEGTLLVSDHNAFDTDSLRKKPETYLKNLTRDNVQLLINKIWSLPTERLEEVIVVNLPKPMYKLPRARCIPKPKPLTKWQQFAKEKGIRTKKKGRSKLKWDDELQKWIPTYGYQRAKVEGEKQWLVEARDGDADTHDPFAASTAKKTERRAKNELQRLRNVARARNVKLPRVGIPTAEHFQDPKQLGKAVTVARASTASVGKFQSRLPKEKDAKGISMPGLKKKTKLLPMKGADEKAHNVHLVDSILSKKSKILHVDPAPTSASVGRSRTRGTGKKTAKNMKGAKKPKAGKGKRDTKGRAGGRKRR